MPTGPPPSKSTGGEQEPTVGALGTWDPAPKAERSGASAVIWTPANSCAAFGVSMAAFSLPPFTAVAAGVLVGLSMGLTGGGGAIFAVPLLIYWIGVDPQTAVGISLLTVAVTAAVGVVERWRYGQVEFPTGLLFAAAGMLTAPLGSWLNSRTPEQPLLVAFAILMLVIAARMWQKARNVEERLPPAAVDPGSGPACRRDPEGRLRITSRCATVLALVGLVVGLLSGLFGVGGGFLIVPALVTFAAMGVPRAVGTSLLVMTLVGISAVGSQIAAGRVVPLDIAAGFVAGSVPGLFAGSAIGRRLTGPLLARVFAVAIVAVAIFVIARELLSGSTAAAQEYRELDADRDAFTPMTHTVEFGSALVETAYTYIENRDGPATHSLPELLVRAGILERVELRFGVNYEAGSGGSVVTAVESGEGVDRDEFATEASLLYGCKAILTEQEAWLPRSVGIVEAYTPTAGDVWATEPAATYAFGWELDAGHRIDAGIRYVYAASEEGTFDKWMPSAVLRWPLTERFEVHGEWFGTWTDGLEDEKVRPFAGPGGHVVIAPGLELGLRVGWGLTRDAANFYSDFGFARRY
jgi:uncharacterized membrane protein YfcA